ncbi:hypothetical protein [Rickettsia honei]
MNESNGGRSIKSSFSGLSVRLAKTQGGRKTMRAASIIYGNCYVCKI